MRNGILSDIDADLEAAVAKLVEENGFEVVNAAIFDQLGRFDWPTVQRISNLAKNIANRKKQAKSGKRLKSNALK